MNDPTLALELDHVTKRFGKRPALRDISLKVPRGTALGLIGPNGAGKTTTLKLAMRLLPFEGGSVRVLGSDVCADHLELKQHIGYVPEQCTVYRWMRVAEVLRFCSRFYASWNQRLADELLRMFDLQPRHKVGQLSKGMKAKLLLAVAVAHEPQLLLLDEPMAGLDPVAREEFLDGVLQAINERQQTVVFSSHMLSDVQRVAERVAMLDEGQLILDKPVDELLKSTKRIRAVLSDGARPQKTPASAIYQRVRNREWLLTVGDFSADMLDELRRPNALDTVEVFDIGLEDILKDYVRGRRCTV